MVEFTVIIPARLASTRLPRKPLADLGGAPMIVRVAERARASGARQVVVAADHADIIAACRAHGVDCRLTSERHATGTDRLAEAVMQLSLPAESIVVNVQGDEPLIPPAVIRDVAHGLAHAPDCAIATAAYPIGEAAEFFNPNVVKVVTDLRGRALYFSRAPIPWARDQFAAGPSSLPPQLPARRHVGLYAYRAAFLREFPQLPRAEIEIFESLEQLRALAHGYSIAVIPLDGELPPGVDTPEDLAVARASYGAQR